MASKKETARDLVSKRVKIDEFSNDNLGVVQAYDANTGIARIQRLRSGRISVLSRNNFETIAKQQRRREDAASQAIADAEASNDGTLQEDGEEEMLTIASNVTMGSSSSNDVVRRFDKVEDETTLGKYGQEYLNGEDRYSRIAVKYDAYRGFLRDLREKRKHRRPGPSVLDDLASSESGSKALTPPTTVVLGGGGDMSETLTDSSTITSASSTLPSEWSFPSVKLLSTVLSPDIPRDRLTSPDRRQRSPRARPPRAPRIRGRTKRELLAQKTAEDTPPNGPLASFHAFPNVRATLATTEEIDSEDEDSTRSGEDVFVGSPYGKSGAHLGEGSLQSEQLNETESVDEGDFDIRRTGSTVQFMNDQSESFSMNSSIPEKPTFQLNYPVMITKSGNVCKCQWRPDSNVMLSFNRDETPKQAAMRFLVKHNLPAELSNAIERFVSNAASEDPSAFWRRQVPPPSSLAAVNKYAAECVDPVALEESVMATTATASLTTKSQDPTVLEQLEAKRIEEAARRGGAPKYHQPRQKLPFEKGLSDLLKKAEPEIEAKGERIEEVAQWSSQSPADKAFMILHTLRGGLHDKERTQKTLSVLLKEVSPVFEGTQSIAKHRGVSTLLQAASYHWMDITLQVLVTLIFHEMVKHGEADGRKNSTPNSLRRNALITSNIGTSLSRLRGPQLFVESCVEALRFMAQATAKAAAEVFESNVSKRSRRPRKSPPQDEVMDLKYLDLSLSFIVEAKDDEEWWHSPAPRGPSDQGEYRENPVIVFSVLRFLACVVAVKEVEAVHRLDAAGGIRVCLRTLQRHSENNRILSAALRLLILCVKTERTTKYSILESELPPEAKPPTFSEKGGSTMRKDGEEFRVQDDQESNDIGERTASTSIPLKPLHPVKLIVQVMHRLLGDEQLQQGGTELLKSLAEEPKGREALESIKGGYDWLCQGPQEGNILIHYREGPLKNAGWAIGEQPFSLGTAKEHLMEATAAAADGSKEAAKEMFCRTIEADDLGEPTVHSIHAHHELAMHHQILRDWDKAEEHFKKAIERTEQDIVREGVGANPTPMTTVSGSTLTRGHPSSLTSTTNHTTMGISTSERRLAAARTRRDILVLNRNMMRNARSSNAAKSKPLELWTPERLLAYLPKRLDDPLRREPPAGTSEPVLWEPFDEASLYRLFSVLKRLTLLPNYGEPVKEWQQRIRTFEKEIGTPMTNLAAVEREKDFPSIFAFR